ncbi:DUF1538 domain-containing protein [Lactonifactor longoviformis]|uniref:DUF1538 domain-containing protein n=1 Tax=Lactonifactor longoviformis DSM 17459 TaxID=1122155 RepID=A0A1M4VMD6_9CLOT|nr:DUF1538 domain-containing protein [Lactonifactor longoviformis]SHE69997.1 Protein of unknown function [Lactonifactor longoviformis DSM 17459]
MRLHHRLKEKVLESVSSVLPITVIVLILSITIAPLTPGALILFIFGAVLLILGMGFFTLGVDMSMIPMGEGIGVQMSKSKTILISLAVCLILGILITVAEPDLQVLANQVPAVPNPVLIFTVAAGVGIFLLLAEVRMLFQIPLSYTLVFFYAIIFLMAFCTPDSFVPVSFDSGGVTTGPVTVPFIMALGIGMASVRSDKNSNSDSFGLIALCSIGPVMAVLLLGIFYHPSETVYAPSEIAVIATTKDAAREFLTGIPHYAGEVTTALLPIILLFLVFQLLFRRFHRHQLLKIVSGLVYTYIGLILFLTGVNVGFMPAGQHIGAAIAQSPYKVLLIPIGMLIGYFIVKAEPAVLVLTKQVEEISNGSISQKSIEHSLSIGIALSVGIAMIRILTGISIMWFLIPGYLISLIMTFFVPQIFTGIAFDSGGVASGPMTATFLLPLAMGACEAVGGNILTDAFGIVAMVAMTPLCTIQLLGLSSRLKEHLPPRQPRAKEEVEDCILYFDAED